MYFDAAASLSVEDDGAIIANGTKDAPILLTGVQPVAGFWKGVSIESNSPLNSLKHVTIEYGGNEKVNNCTSALPANLSIGGCNDGARAVVEDCTFRYANGDGLIIESKRDDIASFARNVFAANEGAPIRLNVSHVTVLDAASDFVGSAGMENGQANIIVTNSRYDLDIQSTWLDHKVPYLIEDTVFKVEGALTIVAGVTVVFPEDGSLVIKSEGSINAEGTASAPIVLTTTKKVAGYWRGVYVDSSSPLNVMKHVDIGYGGRESAWTGWDDAANVALADSPD